MRDVFNTTTVSFPTLQQARRATRRLYDHGVLAKRTGRDLLIQIPTKGTAEQYVNLARRLANGG